MKALIIALSLMLANITASEASKREATIEPYLSVRMIERELEPEIAPIGSVSREQFIYEEMEEMVTRESPWLYTDLYGYPFIELRNKVTPSCKPAPTGTIVDKSFRDLAFQKDSKFELMVDVI